MICPRSSLSDPDHYSGPLVGPPSAWLAYQPVTLPYLISGCNTSSPLLRSWSPRSKAVRPSLLNMPKSQANSSARRRALAAKILKFGRVMPSPCSACRRSKTVCCVDRSSGRCAECIAKQRKCDLIVLDSECWSSCLLVLRVLTSTGKKIDSERERIAKEIRETEEARQQLEESLLASSSKISRLRKQLDFVDDREHSLISRELSSIEEVERLEAEPSAATLSPFSDPSLLSPAPWSPDLSNLDWSNLGSFGGIGGAFLDNS